MYHTINDVLSLVNVMHTKAKEVEKRQSIILITAWAIITTRTTI